MFTYENEHGAWYLNGKLITFKNGYSRTIFYFSKSHRPETALDSIPDGYNLAETKRGMPVLKKQRSANG